MPTKTTFHPTRRRFLKQCALTAASSVALPAFIPRHVLGSDRQPGANEQIVLGVIGMGIRGDQLVLNVPGSGRVAAVCDADAPPTSPRAGDVAYLLWFNTGDVDRGLMIDRIWVDRSSQTSEEQP